MTSVLVTGAKGFIGKNLALALSRLPDMDIRLYDADDPPSALDAALRTADIVYHLAGVNRPLDPGEYDTGNRGFTKTMLDALLALGRKPVVVMTSSTQAELDNPYGKSKLAAELELKDFAEKAGAKAVIYRLPNVFGKWCRPFYNSVIATFCHQAAHGEPYRIDDPGKEIEFVYIDDIVKSFCSILGDAPLTAGAEYRAISTTYRVSLGDLARKLDSFKESRKTCVLPDFSDGFDRKLYSTYLSYLEPENLAYGAEKKSDARGYLYELIKSESAGQIFVSKTKPGITRGNHYHDSKVEKFCVVQGDALISFRHMSTAATFSVEVNGEECRIVDIPPGCTHSIKNTGKDDLITIFWANEVFDPQRPDTYFSEV